MGARVDTAANGRIAQEALAKQCYDLLLVDIRMPDMDGKELYAWLKQTHPQLANRVIFATGELITGDIESFLKQSGRPFLPKPFGNGELEAVVNQTLPAKGDKCLKK
jgi:two-component system NtrC family sensor kinase